MTDAQYERLLSAIRDLRETFERGFANIDRCFDEFEERWDRGTVELEERLKLKRTSTRSE